VAREHRIEVKLTDSELEELDELRGGVPRAIWLRQAIHHPPETTDVASREEALAILTSLARDGRVSAAIALARELRGDGEGPSGDSDIFDTLDAIRNGR
jgi:hypothetical protein